MEAALQKAEMCKKKCEQAFLMGQLKKVQVRNDLELKDRFIDLHGFKEKEAKDIVRARIFEIQNDLNTGKLKPSEGDGVNHVLKIVCGRGGGGHGRPVLKFAIPELLVRLNDLNRIFQKEKGYDFYNFAVDGVQLVRFIVGNY